MSNPDINLFRDEEFEEVRLTPEKAVCLGMEFESDDARRAYFREELRKKLPELRQIEGFPIGEDEDIINLSDPPYYTACPNPWLNDFVAEWEQEKVELERQGKRSAEFEVNEPYASDISDIKNDSVYRAHMYHTKVPHTVVMRYLLHYTQPGDIVFDGFAGTGMTGVAAQACGDFRNQDWEIIEKEWIELFDEKPNWGKRHAICNDLSPYAATISYNYNTPANTSEIKNEAERILKETEHECEWLYTTMHQGKPIGKINCIVWSDVLICNNCGKEFVYWDAAVDKENKCLRDDFYCPYCNAIHSKNNISKVYESVFDAFMNKTISRNKSVPVVLVYTVNKKRFEKRPDEFDLSTIKKIDDYKIHSYVPVYLLPDGGETQRNVKIGVTSVHQFYTKRNLIALSTFYNHIQESKLSNKLRFIFTGMINRSTRMNKVHFSKYLNGKSDWDAGYLKGTLYIPPFSVESSVLAQITNKLERYLKAIPMLPKEYDNAISIGSANAINMEDNSVDYIFTDPPFGANITYSELNVLPEAWLKVVTNNQTEAIVNQEQGKDFMFYLDMMSKSYREYFRILKPGKWMTVEFSNTNAGIWNSIQQAITRAGFVIANVAALNKGQGGMRSVTTTTAVKQDLAISCYKPSLQIQSLNAGSFEHNVWSFVEEHLEHLPTYILKENSIEAVAERDQRIIYDRVISYFVQHGFVVPMNAQEFQKGLRERFIERDKMFFTASQALEYESKRAISSNFVPMALFISNEAEGIEWLKRELDIPQTYQEMQPKWMKDMITPKKGDRLPGLDEILEENFIKDEDGKWRKPDAEKAADLEILRGKKLMKEFNLYLEQASKPKAKRMKDTRLEVLRYGFKECYKQKNYQAIVIVGDHIQESLLQEDEVLLQYYDIASMRV